MAESSNGAAAPKKADGTVNKLEVVRRAMGALGRDAKPVQIQEYARKHFRVELSTDLISTYKGDIRREEERKAQQKAGPKPAAPQPMVQKSVAQKQPTKPAAAPAKQPSASAGKSAGFSIEEIAAVKALVGRAGANDVKALIDVVGK